MRKIFISIIILLSAASLIQVSARTKKEIDFPERSPLSNFGLGLGISSEGWGLSLSTPIHRAVMFRLDYNMLLTYPHDPLEVNVACLPGNRAFEIRPDFIRQGFNSHVLRLLFDWDPIRQGKGRFWLTGGLILQNRESYKYLEQYDKSVFSHFGYSGEQLRDVSIINKHGEIYLNPDAQIIRRMHRQWGGLYLGMKFGNPIPKRVVGVTGEIGVPIRVGTVRTEANDIVYLNEGSLIEPVFDSYGPVWQVHLSLYFSLQLTFRLGRD